MEQSGSGDLVFTGICMLLVTLIIMRLCANQVLQRRKLPPGPWAWPILGNFPQLSAADMPHRSLRALAAKYGGLMFLRLGTQPCIVVSTAAVAKELFQTNDANFSSRPTRLYWTINAGSTEYRDFSTPYGPYWRQLRKLCATELFSPRRQASYQKLRTEEVRDMMKSLLEKSRQLGVVINLRLALYGATANNMTRMLTNKRYFGHGVKDQKDKEDLKLLFSRIHYATSTFIISDYVPFLSFIPKLQGYHTEFENIYKFETKFMNKVFEVEKHREHAKERLQENINDDYVPDFVDLMLATPLEDGKPLSDRNIVAMLSNMLTGGADTTSTTVEWAMAELMLHPEVMKRAQDELDKVVGANCLVQESDIPHLPYLQNIVKEAFRMHPAAAVGIPRISTQAASILGFELPAHTHLTLNIFAIHRDPSVYENPDMFNPDRFVDHPEVSPTSGFDSYELIPFSAGRRMCPAYALGNLMVSLLLAHLLHGFHWSLPEGQTAGALDMSELFSLSVDKKIPLCLVAHPKSPAFLY